MLQLHDLHPAKAPSDAGLVQSYRSSQSGFQLFSTNDCVVSSDLPSQPSFKRQKRRVHCVMQLHALRACSKKLF